MIVCLSSPLGLRSAAALPCPVHRLAAGWGSAAVPEQDRAGSFHVRMFWNRERTEDGLQMGWARRGSEGGGPPAQCQGHVPTWQCTRRQGGHTLETPALP